MYQEVDLGDWALVSHVGDNDEFKATVLIAYQNEESPLNNSGPPQIPGRDYRLQKIHNRWLKVYTNQRMLSQTTYLPTIPAQQMRKLIRSHAATNEKSTTQNQVICRH